VSSGNGSQSEALVTYVVRVPCRACRLALGPCGAAGGLRVIGDPPAVGDTGVPCVRWARLAVTQVKKGGQGNGQQ
jgi:hypothetical protein